MRMRTRGETVNLSSAEGANSEAVNLSGKRTLVGRSSGECFITNEATKGESHFRLNFQVQGQRLLF